MRSVDVRALGWVVTRDVCADMLRALVGRPRRVPRAALRRLGPLWSAVRAALDMDRHGSRLDAANRGPQASTRTEAALRVFVERLVASCPAWYGEQALRSRCLHGGATGFAAVALAAILSYVAPTGDAIIGSALLAIGCWKSVTSVQLWQAGRVIGHLGPQAPPPGERQAPPEPGRQPSDLDP